MNTIKSKSLGYFNKSSRNLAKLSSKSFKKLLKITNMNSEIEPNNFWELFKSYRDSECPNPTFSTIYLLNKEYQFTHKVLDSLAREGLIRYQESPLRYALQDVILMSTIREVVKTAETVEIQGSVIYEGKTKYRVLDMQKNNVPLDKHKMDIFRSAFEGIYSELYNFVPKELSLDEQIEWLKSNS